MNRLIAHIRLLRPLNLFIGALAVILSSMIVHYQGPSATLILSVIVIICYNGAANAFNDYIDHEIDKINRPFRPISLGFVNRRTALFLSVILFCIGSITALELNKTAQIISIYYAMPLMIIYSWFLKGIPLIGNITISTILGMTFLGSGAAFDSIDLMIVPAALAFGLTMVREVVKDVADMDGDRLVGLRTYPIHFCLDNTKKLLVALSVIVGVGSFIPFLTGFYGIGYGVLLILTVEIPLGVVVVSVLNNPGISISARSARLLKFSTLGGLIAIYVGTL